MWIRFAIDRYWPITNGTMGGDGVEATPETRAKISASRKGQKLNPKQREICIRNLKATKPGDKLPLSTRQKIAAARRGMAFSADHKRNISSGKRKLSDEQLSLIREYLRSGIPQSRIAKLVGVSQPTVCAVNRSARKFLNA
jgi:hypothetical protein